MTTLEIQARDKSVENAALRKSGFLPAVVYGKKTPSTPITISAKDFAKVWKEAGESGVVNLKGAAGNFDVLIHEISFNAGTDKPEHVDFYAFEKGKKIEVDVPLEFIGVSPAVKDLGGLQGTIVGDRVNIWEIKGFKSNQERPEKKGNQ